MVAAYQTLGLNEQQGMLGNYLKELKQAKEASSAEQVLRLMEFNQNVLQGEMKKELLSGIESSTLLSQAAQVANQHVTIGVQYNKGLLGEVRNLSHTVEEQFKTFANALNEAYNEQTQQMDLIKQFVTAVVLLLLVGIIWQISRSINHQVQVLSDTIHRICETNNVGLRCQMKGNDELVEIGNHFNTLLEKIEQLIFHSQEKSTQLTSSTNSMHDELEGVIEQFHVQADHTSTMTISVQEMVSTISEISDSTSVAVEGVQQAAQNAEAGRNVVVSTVKNVDQLTSILANSQTSIHSLNDHVDKRSSSKGSQSRPTYWHLTQRLKQRVQVNKAEALPWWPMKFAPLPAELTSQPKRSPKWWRQFSHKWRKSSVTLSSAISKGKRRYMPQSS